MELQEAFQARKDALQFLRVQLQVVPQLPDVHAQHDLQSSYVVHLRLHQLCAATHTVRTVSECTAAPPTDSTVLPQHPTFLYSFIGK